MKKIKEVVLIVMCVCVCGAFQGCSDNKETGAVNNTNVEQGNNKDKSVDEDVKKEPEVNKGNEEVNNSESNGDPDLMGDVVSVNNNTISLVKANIQPNGSVTSPKKGTKEAKENITSFKVSDSTTVTIRTQQSAEKFTDSKGKISDIKEDSLINVWGKEEGNDFVASKIVLYVLKK